MLDIKGIDKGALIAALYNGTRSLGMGVLHDLRRDMTRDEGNELAGDRNAIGGRIRFDYIYGRPIKVVIHVDADGSWRELEREDLYDRDACQGACARAVERARAAS